ncbi:MAG: FtsQ-type POTRA domain-containing protein [Spirochaetes bacterium]|nr:FtsQ-type POTRA domain-containing protein [Spirochaetota bacterium]
MSDYAVYRGRTAAGSRDAEIAVQVFLGSALAAIVGAFVLFFFAVPATTITRYSASGTSIPVDDLVRWSGARGGMSWFNADCEGMARAIASNPMVASARVARVFPNGLLFAVVERKAVAVALVETGAGVVPAAIDREGIAFADARSIGRLDLPVISGVRFENFRFGLALPDGMIPMLESLALIAAEQPALLSFLSEIKPVKRAYGEFDFMVYPLNYRTPVRTGSSLNGPLLQSMALVLDVVESGGFSGSIGELDFRSGTVVYRLKEGVSG